MDVRKLGGSIVALVTPFNEDGSVNFDQLERLLEFHVENGTDAILTLGTTGESATMTDEEDNSVVKFVVDHVAGRVPVIAGSGSNCTAVQTAKSLTYQKLGADAVLIISPYYNKSNEEGIYQHLKHTADATDIPCILYNIPGRCVINMTAETTLRLANEVDNIVAIKEASGNLEQVAAILAGAPEGFEVYSGDDALTYDIMKLGGAGVISTIGNVAPDRMKEIVDLCAAGDFEAAAKANEALLPLMNELFITSNPIMVKEALNLLGLPVGGVRLPLVNATAEQSAELAEVMRQVGVLK